MNRELGLLNLICIVAALLFLVLIVVNALTSGDVLSTDNLFITSVGLLMALMFAVNPLLYLKSEGKLPIPFSKKNPSSQAQISGTSSSTPPLLDAKGRAVPPDVRALVSQMAQAKTKDA
jgi:hypothetical protein